MHKHTCSYNVKFILYCYIGILVSIDLNLSKRILQSQHINRKSRIFSDSCHRHVFFIIIIMIIRNLWCVIFSGGLFTHYFVFISLCGRILAISRSRFDTVLLILLIFLVIFLLSQILCTRVCCWLSFTI